MKKKLIIFTEFFELYRSQFKCGVKFFILIFSFLFSAQQSYAQSLAQPPIKNRHFWQNDQAKFELFNTYLRFNQSRGVGPCKILWFTGLPAQSNVDIGIIQRTYKITNKTDRALSKFQFLARKNLYSSSGKNLDVLWFPASFISTDPVRVGMRKSPSAKTEWRQPRALRVSNDTRRVVEFQNDILPGETVIFWDYLYLRTGVGGTVLFDGEWGATRTIFQRRDCTLELFKGWHKGRDPSTSGYHLAIERINTKKIEEQKRRMYEAKMAKVYHAQNVTNLKKSKSFELMKWAQRNNIGGCRYSKSFWDKMAGFDDACFHVEFSSVEGDGLSYTYDRLHGVRFNTSSTKNNHLTLLGPSKRKFTFFEKPKIEYFDSSIRVLLGEEDTGRSKWFIGLDVIKSSPNYHPLLDLFD